MRFKKRELNKLEKLFELTYGLAGVDLPKDVMTADGVELMMLWRACRDINDAVSQLRRDTDTINTKIITRREKRNAKIRIQNDTQAEEADKRRNEEASCRKEVQYISKGGELREGRHSKAVL